MFWTAVAIGAWMLACSTASFFQYGLDKRRARRARRRISERTLLFTALLGGWPGALVAGRIFRHKTRKQPYRRRLSACIGANLALLLGLVWLLRTAGI